MELDWSSAGRTRTGNSTHMGLGPVGSGDRWRMLSLERESEIDGGTLRCGRTVTTSFSFSFALLAHPAALSTTGSSMGNACSPEKVAEDGVAHPLVGDVDAVGLFARELHGLLQLLDAAR